MENRLPLTDKNGEVRELKKKDFKSFKAASEVLPAELISLLPKRGGRPAGTSAKRSTTVRFDNDILESFRSTGKGWQTRMNDALREWLKEHNAR